MDDGHLPDLVRRAALSDVDLQDGLAAVVETLRPRVGAGAAIDDLPPITAQTARLVGQVLLSAAIPLEEEAKSSEAVLAALARLHNASASPSATGAGGTGRSRQEGGPSSCIGRCGSATACSGVRVSRRR